MTRLSSTFVWVILGCLYPFLESTDPAAGGAPTQNSVPEAAVVATPRTKYVGDQLCLLCHKDQALSYLHTAHHLTSQTPGKDSIFGSFEEGANTLKIADPAPVIGDPGLYYKMENHGDSYSVTAVSGFEGQWRTRSEQIAIVIGSGVRGQSYLYWRGDRLFELPVSYWSDGRQWINSPGFRNGPPNFDRVVSQRCVECHATYLRALSPDPAANRYDKATLVTGISCETCHGPGNDHVAAHRSSPSAATKAAGKKILNPANFSRDRQVDLCALCHNGARQEEIAPAFSYLPGNFLDNFLRPNRADTAVDPDVHANQVGLLKRSRCYVSSPKMNCSTCHDVHAPERPAASYSNKCLSCHQVESCGMAKTMGHRIAENCIDCHMPVEQTKAIVSETGDKVIRTTMRTHWIKTYPAPEQP
jgi:hypothetical protein